jgi:uncharacterized protein
MPMSAASALSAAEIIKLLELQPHPEGGHFCQIFRDTQLIDGKRPASTAIYFLLARGEHSHWHRVDAAEGWHWYAGAPLRLAIVEEGKERIVMLGADLKAGQRPQAVVPAHAWQSADTLGDWTLVGCTVAPGFVWEGFELAPKDWTSEQMQPVSRV